MPVLALGDPVRGHGAAHVLAVAVGDGRGRLRGQTDALVLRRLEPSIVVRLVLVGHCHVGALRVLVEAELLGPVLVGDGALAGAGGGGVAVLHRALGVGVREGRVALGVREVGVRAVVRRVGLDALVVLRGARVLLVGGVGLLEVVEQLLHAAGLAVEGLPSAGAGAKHIRGGRQSLGVGRGGEALRGLLGAVSGEAALWRTLNVSGRC